MAKTMVLVMLGVLAVGTSVSAATAGSVGLAVGAGLMWVGIVLLARLPWVPRAEHGRVFARAGLAIGCYLAGVVTAALAISGLD
ncbi:hypothetical protein [Nocardioides sp.]|uniref:hypothetical protein n=1 Tax=Nocardioides sp. TaxID=35761 RepID=UPI001A2CEB78|nr:hypothetical protein [Nocardioides sp.]MBJ7358573.1 hypothetical protein [Nocardioides sp.]